MAPWTAQPLHRPAIADVAGDPCKRVEHVVGAHLAESVEESAGVLEHDPRLEPLVEKLGYELAHSLVAPQEHRGVVVVTDSRVVQHPLQIADHSCCPKLRAARWDEWLVHVQGNGEGTIDLTEPQRTPGKERPIGPAGPDGLLDVLLSAGDVGKPINMFGDVAHNRAPLAGLDRLSLCEGMCSWMLR